MTSEDGFMTSEGDSMTSEGGTLISEASTTFLGRHHAFRRCLNMKVRNNSPAPANPFKTAPAKPFKTAPSATFGGGGHPFSIGWGLRPQKPPATSAPGFSHDGPTASKSSLNIGSAGCLPEPNRGCQAHAGLEDGLTLR